VVVAVVVVVTEDVMLFTGFEPSDWNLLQIRSTTTTQQLLLTGAARTQYHHGSYLHMHAH